MGSPRDALPGLPDPQAVAEKGRAAAGRVPPRVAEAVVARPVAAVRLVVARAAGPVVVAAAVVRPVVAAAVEEAVAGDDASAAIAATPRILVVDDDAGLRELVVPYLERSGFAVEGVGDAEAFRASYARERPDLAVLDLMLPGEDGLSLLRWLKANEGPPVIIASARGDEVDRVVGLEVGADDYLPKPFGTRELLARIRAVLRRAQPPATAGRIEAQTFGPWRFDVADHVLTGPEGEVTLTTGEFTLLRTFIEHPNQILSRDRLITLIKGYDRSPFDRSIDVRVSRLRQKIERDPENPVYLRTIWGEGYLFSPRGRGSG